MITVGTRVKITSDDEYSGKTGKIFWYDSVSNVYLVEMDYPFYVKDEWLHFDADELEILPGESNNE